MITVQRSASARLRRSTLIDGAPIEGSSRRQHFGRTKPTEESSTITVRRLGCVGWAKARSCAPCPRVFGSAVSDTRGHGAPPSRKIVDADRTFAQPYAWSQCAGAGGILAELPNKANGGKL